MNHLTEDQFFAYQVDQLSLPAAELVHVAVCSACQAEMAQVQYLAAELKIAQRSSPSPATRMRYQQLFVAVQQTANNSGIGDWLQRLVGKLTWDSRQQLVSQGARSVAAPNYRLLYLAAKAELELMVSPQAQKRRVDGDLIALGGQEPLTPALVQLQPVATAMLYETASDPHGRFHLDAVPTGRYTLLVTPPQGVHLAFDLEIT